MGWFFLSNYLTTIMITSETPDKLAEIIRDTWPNLFRLSADSDRSINKKKSSCSSNEAQARTRTT